MKFKYLSLIMLIGASVAQGSDDDNSINAELAAINKKIAHIIKQDSPRSNDGTWLEKRSTSAMKPRRSPLSPAAERAISAPARLKLVNRAIQRLIDEEVRLDNTDIPRPRKVGLVEVNKNSSGFLLDTPAGEVFVENLD